MKCLALRSTLFRLGIAAVGVAVAGGCGAEESGPGTDYVCSACVSVPDAQPADDHLRSGVYKGILVDVDDTRSLSGFLRVVVATDETTGTATFWVNGSRYESTTYALRASPTGDTNANGAADPGEEALFAFAGGSFAFDLTVGPTGDVMEASLEWDGESARVVVVKETSAELVECFEGTWSGTVAGSNAVAGVWNFIVAGSLVSGAYDSDFFGGSGTFHGAFAGSNATVFEEDGDPLATGVRTNDYVGGPWEQAASLSEGMWSGSRQL